MVLSSLPLIIYVESFEMQTEFTLPQWPLKVIFNFSDISDDWNNFLNGKYSKISIGTKRRILEFFDKKSGNYAYVESYLFPEKHFETYARILGVDVNMLISVGELCDKPDLDKENLLIEVADLENIKIIQ